MSSFIGPCDDLSINPTGTAGSAGKSWYQVTWAVSSNGNILNSLQDYLNLNYNSSTSALVTVPNSLFTPRSTYSISLTVKNYFGKFSSLSKTLKILDDSNIPIVIE